MSPVLIVGPIEPPIGGVSRYCRHLADLLRHHRLEAIPLDPDRAGASDPGAVRRALLFPVSRTVGRATPSIARAARRGAVRLVLDNRQAVWREPASARGARLLVRAPFALIIHDGAFPSYVDGLAERPRHRLATALRRMTGVICMSDPILESVAALAPLARARRLSPLLAAPDAAIPLPSEAESFLGRPGIIVSASGALHPQYGLEELIAALVALRARGSKARLMLLLGSFARDETTAMALAAARERLGPEGLLVLTDCAAGASIIARSTLYVRPSRVDSFGLALHEAMLAGVPVVASEHPTRPEGVLTYPSGDVRALAAAIEEGLRPEARAAAAGRVAPLRGLLDENRRKTVDLVMALSSS